MDEQKRKDATPCTLTRRLTDCWEYGCQGAEDCEYRKATAHDRYLADTGKLPGMVFEN